MTLLCYDLLGKKRAPARGQQAGDKPLFTVGSRLKFVKIDRVSIIPTIELHSSLRNCARLTAAVSSFVILFARESFSTMQGEW